MANRIAYVKVTYEKINFVEMGGAPEPDPDRGGAREVGGARDGDIALPAIANTDRDRDRDSEDEEGDGDGDGQAYRGYRPLAQAPPGDPSLAIWSNSVYSDQSSESSEGEDDDVHDDRDLGTSTSEIEQSASVGGVPFIESVDREVTREIWGRPRTDVDIQMDATRAREVMSAMANFSLPTSSIPEWARDVSEDEWKRKSSLKDFRL